MSTAKARARGTWTPLAFALALAALAAGHLALRRDSFNLPLMSDEGEYAYAAQAWSAGGLPYRDAYFQKPPMIVLLYRAAYAARPGDLLAPRRLAVLFTWLSMLFLFLLTPEDWGPAARLSAPAIYGVLSTSPIGSLGFPANTEVFLCAFTCLGALAAARSFKSARPAAWILLCGLASGAALMTKQTSLWTVLSFALLAAFGRKRRFDGRAAAAFAAGAAFVPALFAGYFLARGGLGAFIADAYGNNVRYASAVVGTSSVGRQFAWFLRRVAPLFAAGDWPVWAAAAWGLAGTQARWDEPETLATLWLGTGLTGAVTGLFFFPYYFLQALPPLAFAGAAGVRKLGRKWRAVAAAALCLYPVLIRGRAYFILPPRLEAARLLYPNPLFEAADLGEYIRERSAPEDSVYVFGSEPHVYVYAGRRAATEHIFVFPLTTFPGGEGEIAAELAKVEAASPKFVVYSTQPGSTMIASRLGERFRDGVRDLLNRRYRLAGRTDFPENPSGPPRLTPASGAADWDAPSTLFLFERAR
jgi:4-amino-4-deoxy-L-arabinose transferase-like glycosyltransferase